MAYRPAEIMPPPGYQLKFKQKRFTMLSRVANSIYWMARNVQRAENIARFIEVTHNFTIDQPENGLDQWEPLVRATGDEEYYAKHYSDFSAENVCQFLTFDKDYQSSILSSVSYARENARTVREAISSEAWEQLNSFFHFVTNASNNPDKCHDPLFYDAIVQNSYLFNGIIDGTMTRGTGWHFANVGRLIERADKTSRILDVKYFTLLRNVSDVNTTYDDLLWSAVLRSVSGFEMFRKHYHALTVERIVEFLILDEGFPRAIRHCVQRAGESLKNVSGPVAASENKALVLTSQLVDDLDNNDAERIINGGLHEFIDSIQTALNEISVAIHDTYFAFRSLPDMFQQQQQQQR